MKLNHVWFGAILGEDGRPFGARSGEIIRLSDLLNEAEQRAFDAVTEKSPDLSEDDRREIARVVGIGAIKYADLSGNRQSDYVFSWDNMLALVGNTAPYLLYAYTRIRSIFRKLEGESIEPPASFSLGQAEEVALAKHLLRFGLVLEQVIDECRPNFSLQFTCTNSPGFLPVLRKLPGAAGRGRGACPAPSFCATSRAVCSRPASRRLASRPPSG